VDEWVVPGHKTENNVHGFARVEITIAVLIIRYLFACIYTALGTEPGLLIHVGSDG
jgi:hypothetical protein